MVMQSEVSEYFPRWNDNFAVQGMGKILVGIREGIGKACVRNRQGLRKIVVIWVCGHFFGPVIQPATGSCSVALGSASPASPSAFAHSNARGRHRECGRIRESSRRTSRDGGRTRFPLSVFLSLAKKPSITEIDDGSVACWAWGGRCEKPSVLVAGGQNRRFFAVSEVRNGRFCRLFAYGLSGSANNRVFWP